MSVNEEGIPLMQVFGEEQQSDDDDRDNPFEDEEDEVETHSPAHGHSNNRRHICFGAVLVCALVLVVALVMGFTIPTLIIQNEGGTVDNHHGGTTGNTKTGTKSSMTLTSTSETMRSMQASTPTSLRSMTLHLPKLSTSSVPTVTPSTSMMAKPGSPVLMTTPSSSPVPVTTPSIPLIKQTTPVMTQSTPTLSSSFSPVPMTTRSTTVMSVPTTSSVPMMNQSTPTMSQPSFPVPVTTRSNIMTDHCHSSVAMTTQLSSYGILPTHSAPLPTLYIASKRLAATPEMPSVSSQKQMVSTVLPTPTPSSSSARVTVSASYTSSPTATPAMTPSPTSGAVGKSAMDHRTYQVLYLEDKLRVLLISDPNTSISAAAMDVAVGSFSDPPEVQGLAHFCEHMLFLGTQKYPKKDDYSNFLSTHGGNDNAFTSTQETNYYFSVQADYLEQALDRFAQFFISPLFTPGAVKKESHAVNAEHEKNLQSDGWRLWQLLKHVSNPSHPFSRFATGNLETLNNPDILTYLHNYYTSHYSANQV